MKKNSTDIYAPYVEQLTSLLQDSLHQQDPAYWLYLNKARTPLFMLEALSRIVYKATNDPVAKEGRKLFKKLEDMLGEIDFYDVFVKQFKSNSAIKKEQVVYLESKLEKVTSRLNKKLTKNYFYSEAINGFIDNNPGDFNDKGLLIALHEEMKTEILQAEEFFSEYHNGFTDFEEQVHELRRKLRWISIYAASLGGYAALKPVSKKYKWEKEFVTKNDRENKYNKLPIKKGLPYYILLNKKAFYALSHVIEKLGEIKDKGLAIQTLAKALRKTTVTGRDADYNAKARALLGIKETESELLKQAYDLLYRFFVVNKIHIELIS